MPSSHDSDSATLPPAEAPGISRLLAGVTAWLPPFRPPHSSHRTAQNRDAELQG